MSQVAVVRFLELIAADKTMEATLDAAAEQQADVAARAVELGRNLGLEFTRDELASAVEAFHREHSGELDDTELQRVSGGINPQPEPPGLAMPSLDVPWFSQNWASSFRPRP